nr:hypothetical protein [Candidatus Brocadiales bacterium]
SMQALNQSEALGGQRIRITKDIINGKVGFKLEIGELIYTVEPHVRLGKEQGVAYPCEPDFLISLDKESDEKINIAVFLDGYRYHKDIVHEDLMKRQGISLGGDLLTWSLTWHDINHVFAGSEVKIPNALRENTDNAPQGFIERAASAKGLSNHNKIAELSPLVLLLKILSKPNIDYWRSFSMLRVLSWVNQKKMAIAENKQDFESQCNFWPSHYVDTFTNAELIFCSSNKTENTFANMDMYIAGEQDAITDLSPEALVLSVIFDPVNTDHELTKNMWQKLLQILNIGQFLPKFFVGTKQGIHDGNFAQLEWRKKPEVLSSGIWDKIYDLADDDVSAYIKKLSDHSLPVPEVGYELVNNKGVSVAEGELAWEDIKVVFLLNYQIEEGKKVFEEYKWTVLTLESDMDDMIRILRG